MPVLRPTPENAREGFKWQCQWGTYPLKMMMNHHMCVCVRVNLKLINDKQVEEALLTVTRNDFSVFKGQNQTAQAR